MKIRAAAVGYLVFVVGVLGALYLIQQQGLDEINRETQAVAARTAHTLYLSDLAACERGNRLRKVVYANTREAAKIQSSADYSTQLQVLSAARYALCQ